MIPKKLKAKTIKAILKHAEAGYPNEICGVVVITEKGEEYIRCVNTSTDPAEEFSMCPVSYLEAEAQGEVVGIVHSHPDWTTQPSNHDIAVMTTNRELQLMVDPDSKPIPWHIVSWPEGDYRQVVPEVRASLLGRPFVHGIWDCWATCEDYYKKYHGIEFEPFEREDLWWENRDNKSLYEDYYEGAGFYQVNDLLPGDMVVMQIGRSYHPNHAGIYLGDRVTNFEGREFHSGIPVMLHHLYGKNSDVIVYGGQWHQRTRLILRHKGVTHGKDVG